MHLHCPGIERRGFDVEDHEEHRDEVETHRKTAGDVGGRLDAALVRFRFHRVGLLAGQDSGQDAETECCHERHGEIDSDRTIGRHDLKIYTKTTRLASVIGLVAAVAIAGCAPNPNGQGVTDTGTVTGRVVDASHPTEGVPSAVVQVGYRITRLTPGDKGGFTLTGVQTGTQPVLITSPGFATYQGSVVVHKDQVSDISYIALAPVGP